MSKVVIDQTEVSTDKPESVATENPIISTEKDSLNTNDTNSSTQNEVSPLKRDSSEVSGIDEKTPARAKKTRTDKFKEESEALLKSFGLEDGPGSEKRLTRSRTGRGITPVSTPVSKTEPVKQNTGAKRGRRPSEKKEQVVAEEDTVKPTPRKGRGRPKQNSVDNGENSSLTEESTKIEAESNVAGDQNDKSSEMKDEPESKSEDKKEANSTEEKKLIVPEVVVTKEDTEDSSTDKVSDKKNDTTTESSKPESKSDTLIVQKEEVKAKSTNLNEIKSVESSKKTPTSINSTDGKMTAKNDTSKVENNLTNNNLPVKEPMKKSEPVDQSAKPVEKSTEKVVEKNKLTTESVEKQEVQTA